jgi:large subunit ribosomal protein L20
MVRIKTNVYSHKRKKRVLKEARGQFGDRSKRYKEAAKSLTASKQYAYFDRKKNAGHFRALWIVRLNAACRDAGLSYSRFIKGLSNAGISLDRKMLSEIAISSPDAFSQIVDLAKNAPAAAPKAKALPAIKAKHASPKAKVRPNSAVVKRAAAKRLAATAKPVAVKPVAKKAAKTKA